MENASSNTERYIQIYSVLKEEFRWKVTNHSVLMMAASLYISTNRNFDMARFAELAEYIKSESRLFSPLRSESRFMFAAMLDTRFENPEEKFPVLIKAYDELVSGGFSKNIYTYIAAMLLITKNTEEIQLYSGRAREIYKKMKGEHWFLTGHSDYPLAVMLAQDPRQADELIARMEDLYTKLSQNGFRKGNDLQSMSHILSLHETRSADDLVMGSAEINDRMKEEGIKPKTMFYPQIALLTFIERGIDNLAEIREVWEQLNAEKPFKWKKDINFMMAVTFVINDKIENSPLLQANLTTTIETMIQAQQAASIAAISGAVAANSSSGGE
ncbi:DUF4003 family protein [Bacillus sp. REN3]|uniref:DUF4003 family protein n=1 Tax=Bacillus sp. REN3 TaxID=2802440 RepID=UPI001AEDD2E3|nr:DUF4003 family protein [Bacillus sp. REN3]